MPRFKYIAKKGASGETYQGEKDADDKFSLYKIVKAEGDEVLSVQDKNKKKQMGLSFKFEFGSGMNIRDRINFARNLGSMMEAGLSLSRALSVMERQASSKMQSAIVARINTEVGSGKSFSEALKLYPRIFSKLFVSMVRAGEESGELPNTLKLISAEMVKTYALQKKIKSAMIYPAIIIGVVIVIGILMMMFVVPTLTATFKDMNVPLPFATRAIIFVSDAMKNHYIYFFSFLIAVATGIVLLFRLEKVKRFAEFILLKIPLISPMIKEANSARTARTLSSLLASGVDIVLALQVTADVLQNRRYKDVLIEASKVVEKGDPMSKIISIHEDLYPPFVSEMLAVGEETGKLGEMLLGAAVFYEEEVDQKTKDLSTIIEPLLMIMIGVAVGLFAIAIIQPMYSLVNFI